MAARGRDVGVRPRWPDLVIVVSIALLAVVGVTALFGSAIRGWFEPAATAPVPVRTPGRTL